LRRRKQASNVATRLQAAIGASVSRFMLEI